VSGTALAAGNVANPRPVASAIPLTYFSNGAKEAVDAERGSEHFTGSCQTHRLVARTVAQ